MVTIKAVSAAAEGAGMSADTAFAKAMESVAEVVSNTAKTIDTGGAIALSGSDTFDNRGIIVLRTSNTGVRALSRNCTHAGFTVNINTAANNLVCPSHNSIFDLNGNVVSGPASGALTRYSASLSGSIITISQGA